MYFPSGRTKYAGLHATFRTSGDRLARGIRHWDLAVSYMLGMALLREKRTTEGQVLLDRLAKKPVARADLEKTIAEALDGHLCRCTGYIKYHEAVRDVILADPGRYLG